jgi:hypothetical protein
MVSLVCPGEDPQLGDDLRYVPFPSRWSFCRLDRRLYGHKRTSPKWGFKRPLPSRSQGWDNLSLVLTAGHSDIPETPEAPLRVARRLETTPAKGEPW